MTTNAYFRMINGNRGSSHNIGMWNCRKGLIDGENQPTYKMVEVKQFIEDHNLSFFLYSTTTTNYHYSKWSTNGINPKC